MAKGSILTHIAAPRGFKDGVMHTDDTLVDGLEADIAAKGSVNLVRRDLNMKRLSHQRFRDGGRGCGFVVNPLLAAVFAASKVLGLLVESKVPPAIRHFGVRWTIRKPERSVAPTGKEKRNDLTRARNCPNLI